MAIFHCTIKIISRGKGKSAVAAAAYRAAQTLTNHYDGITHDYTNKGGVVYTEILLPGNAPSEYAERSVLWNAVEKIEKASNAQLAREIEIGLPAELTQEQNISLAHAYVKEHFVDNGMCADICVHDKNDGNPHAHIMLTMRPFEDDGIWGAKQKKEYILDDNGKKLYDKTKRQYKCRSIASTDWNERNKAEEWRRAWADMQNAALEKYNHPARVDHRSYERQGIGRVPTIHMGVAATQMERKGIATDRGNINREIAVTNKLLRQTKARIRKLQDWLKEEGKNIAPPTLHDIISNILHKSDRRAITNLKEGAKILLFLQQNEITDLHGLEKKLRDMIGAQLSISNKLKPINRRLETLDKHFIHSENFKQYRKFKSQYDKLYAEYKTLEKSSGLGAKRKTQKALDVFNEYAETHRREITLYDAAEQYLKDTLQGHFDSQKLPFKKWQNEHAELLSQKDALNDEYKKLKNETREVEIMRREVEQIIGSERSQQKSLAQEMDI